jgi:hypothetical protein
MRLNIWSSLRSTTIASAVGRVCNPKRLLECLFWFLAVDILAVHHPCGAHRSFSWRSAAVEGVCDIEWLLDGTLKLLAVSILTVQHRDEVRKLANACIA